MSVTVDFLARGESESEYRMVLVEHGPWEEIDVEMRRVQERLYGCIEAALDGDLARKFPESHGKIIVIRLDGYDLPEDEVSAFFERFADGIMKIPDYAEELRSCEYVEAFRFELNFEALPQN